MDGSASVDSMEGVLVERHAYACMVAVPFHIPTSRPTCPTVSPDSRSRPKEPMEPRTRLYTRPRVVLPKVETMA